MVIKILGIGCHRCKTLEKITQKAISDLGIDAEILKVEDIVEIMNYGVTYAPGLVINEKLVLSGRLPSITEVKEFLINNQEK